jgi:hypothetical protein
MIMENLLILYVANLILDYPLQGTFLAEYKAKNNYILFVHCAIWALGLSVVLMPLGLFAWWKVIMLLVGHIVIDYWKCRGLYKKWNIKDWTSLYIDQSLHVIQVLLCLI